MKIVKQRSLGSLGLVLVLALWICGHAAAKADEQDATVADAAESDEATSEISDEDRATMALDSTATQWSFQFAWQVMPGYHEDELANGETRKPGNTDFAQLRIVAPTPLKGFTILPRLTVRHYENAQGQSGIGNTEIFWGDTHVHTNNSLDARG